MKPMPIIASVAVDQPSRQFWRDQIGRLPLTMQPAFQQQLSTWDDLFPYEQNRLTRFLGAVSKLSPAQLDELTGPLRQLESKMDVVHWNFSRTADTMENASLLARSPYYAQWRREIRRVFSAIESSTAESSAGRRSQGRLIFLVLPESLPIKSIPSGKPWDPRATMFQIDGDARQVCELALRGEFNLPAQLGAADASDAWLIDADARLGALLGSSPSAQVSLLEYATLKNFRDQFLAEVNTVPKDIGDTDQILDRVRHQNWDAYWPTSLVGQNRLRSFVIQLFLSGNGALIFSNAFVQWAASEALRRVRPRLLVCRFGLRSKPKPFTSIAIFENQQKISALRDVEDPDGSAIDALILARYVWLSAVRYPELDQTCCVCVAESSRSAYVIAPPDKRPTWSADHVVSSEAICAWMRSILMDCSVPTGDSSTAAC